MNIEQLKHQGKDVFNLTLDASEKGTSDYKIKKFIRAWVDERAGFSIKRIYRKYETPHIIVEVGPNKLTFILNQMVPGSYTVKRLKPLPKTLPT